MVCKQIPFLIYLAQGKEQEKMILNFARGLVKGGFNSWNCLYRWNKCSRISDLKRKGKKNQRRYIIEKAGFTDDKYKKLSLEKVTDYFRQIQDSSKLIVISGKLGELGDELLIGLYIAHNVSGTKNKEYYWINYSGKSKGSAYLCTKDKIFPYEFRQNDFVQGKLRGLREELNENHQ